MLKTSYFRYTGVAIIALSLVAGNIALAEDINSVNEVRGTNEVRNTNEVRDTNEAQNVNEGDEVKGIKDVNEVRETNEVKGINEAQNGQNDQGKLMSEEHASEVSAFVKTLADIADRDQNIGEEVRAVAKEQNDQKERDNKAIQSVETRSAFKTFLIGTDYKNTGEIRSGLVTTQNNIDRLTNALEKTTDAQIKIDLQAQIDALKVIQTKMDDFVKTNESKFSLLGWLVRLFNK